MEWRDGELLVFARRRATPHVAMALFLLLSNKDYSFCCASLSITLTSGDVMTM